MPNHITNIINVTGDKIRIKELFDFVSNENILFDFNKIVPMPESLQITSGSMVDNAIHIITNDENALREYFDYEWVKQENITTIKELKKFLSKKLKPIDFREARQAIRNIEKYGHKDWYSWRIAYWGTKWNAYDFECINENSIKFNTAWGTPFSVIEALSKKYNDLRIEVKYADEDLGYNCGMYVFEDGKLIEEFDPQGWAGIKFALSVKGLLIEDLSKEIAYRFSVLNEDLKDDEFDKDICSILNDFNNNNNILFLNDVYDNCKKWNNENIIIVKDKIKRIALENEIYELMNKIDEIFENNSPQVTDKQSV